MIDQRVSGIQSNLQCKSISDYTSTLIKNFNIPVVPVYIERTDKISLQITIHKPVNFPENHSIQNITDELNFFLKK